MPLAKSCFPYELAVPKIRPLRYSLMNSDLALWHDWSIFGLLVAESVLVLMAFLGTDVAFEWMQRDSVPVWESGSAVQALDVGTAQDC